ncbi:hypothetical protein K458DRAFT_297131 [Lentithecium fluviatile CBS 122367]|uniref:Zn(2)-C6 fungal-type domain-containing protein n=1 Tax=Lentithecium fluviatile CBS 122367 TaxID=1168545 RepID=A0A6G1JA31_9PLEO|nr:hypothetical protein K458DRAFT_297131 [Lentithecium fluviatile CBS 122367]
MTTTPRRKACVECRQQKIRCDVEQHKTSHQPCTRCRKMNLECRILPTSTRNLRQTKAEMRRELEELRWNMRQGQPHEPSQPHSTPGSTFEGHGAFHSPMEPASGMYSSREETEASESMSPHFEAPGSGGFGPERKARTVARSLEGFLVDAKKIDDCFGLYFSQYNPLLPILDSHLSPTSPNEYYELSPFLFWSIVVTGSRQYSDDPTVLDRISQLITPLAFSSMALRSTPIPVIQGLLILCTWRLPTSSMYKDMTHVLCGAAVHLATQIGLHVAGVGQDFARTPLKKDQDQKIFRAKLWMHCVIVSIRTSCAEGIPPLVIADSFFDGGEKEREDTLAYLPADLQFNHKLHIILHKALAAMSRTHLKSINCDVTNLRSLISVFDSQLLTLATTSPSELDTFQLNCARIHVLAFHFFAHPTHPGPDTEALIRLYSLCVSTLQAAHTMTQETNFAFISQSFIDRTVSLAGFCLLKLCRSTLSQHLDLAEGERAYVYAAQFSKSTSLQKNDLGERCAAILTNLWGSSRVFRRKNGVVESLGIRLRTRLSMSVSFDMFWYWREEFGHMANPYNGEDAIPSNAQTQPTTPDYEKEAKEAIRPHQQPNPSTAPGTTSTAKLEPIPAQTQTQPQPQLQTRNQNQSRQATQLHQQMPPNTSQNSANMSFDTTWDGSEFGGYQPMLDQFPDYDWAASFDFSSEWPTVPMQIPGPGEMFRPPAGYNFC